MLGSRKYGDCRLRIRIAGMIGKPSMSSDVSSAILSRPKAGSRTSEKRTMALVARSWVVQIPFVRLLCITRYSRRSLPSSPVVCQSNTGGNLSKRGVSHRDPWKASASGNVD